MIYASTIFIWAIFNELKEYITAPLPHSVSPGRERTTFTARTIFKK
jgi:hypothetical protein